MAAMQGQCFACGQFGLVVREKLNQPDLVCVDKKACLERCKQSENYKRYESHKRTTS